MVNYCTRRVLNNVFGQIYIKCVTTHIKISVYFKLISWDSVFLKMWVFSGKTAYFVLQKGIFWKNIYLLCEIIYLVKSWSAQKISLIWDWSLIWDTLIWYLTVLCNHQCAKLYRLIWVKKVDLSIRCLKRSTPAQIRCFTLLH